MSLLDDDMCASSRTRQSLRTDNVQQPFWNSKNSGLAGVAEVVIMHKYLCGNSPSPPPDYFEIIVPIFHLIVDFDWQPDVMSLASFDLENN